MASPLSLPSAVVALSLRSRPQGGKGCSSKLLEAVEPDETFLWAIQAHPFRRWAHLARDHFPDGQLYINLRGYDTAAPLPAGEVLNRFLRALDAGQVRPLLPGAPGCLVLVTSRNPLTGLVAQYGARPLRLDVLTPAEARTLVDGLLGSERAGAEPDAVDELCRLCAYLPLALRLAAASLLADPHRRVADYVDELRSGNRLAALTVDGDEHTAVRAAFDLSYAKLPEPARRLFAPAPAPGRASWRWVCHPNTNAGCSSAPPRAWPPRPPAEPAAFSGAVAARLLRAGAQEDCLGGSARPPGNPSPLEAR